jgi:CDP-diacylglycerol--serine O-phosphatidyltransferase
MQVKLEPGGFDLPEAPWRFFHLSNLVTYGVAIAGVIAIRGAYSGAMWQAGAALAIASLFDLFDGMYARRFSRSPAYKRFGVEIDSLSDAFSFGAVPIAVATASAEEWPWWWISAAIVYLLCALTRLGYYNLQTEERGGFVGVPTTLMGLAWSSLCAFPLTASVSGAMFVAGGVLMVSPLRIPRPKPAILLCVAATAIVLAVWHALNGLSAQTQ